MKWKDDKRWVYSITYDEGCQALLEHAVEVHRGFGVPGHLALVASQIGVPRNVPGSSYDGMMILSKAQIQALCAEGRPHAKTGKRAQRVGGRTSRRFGR